MMQQGPAEEAGRVCSFLDILSSFLFHMTEAAPMASQESHVIHIMNHTWLA
jgi:hypothetical protein